MSTGLGRVHATSGELMFGNEHDLNLPPERSTSASATKNSSQHHEDHAKLNQNFFLEA